MRDSLYFLGYLASLLFGLRFFYQWYSSEKRRESYVPPPFWYLSLFANLLMALHGLIQLQYPILLIQSCNCIFSWRNIRLIKHERDKDTLALAALLVGVATMVTLLYYLQALFLDNFSWMRISSATPPSLLWHICGMAGIFLFGARFWIQWFMAEKAKSSFISHHFWKMSLIGGALSLSYFIRLQDPVNILGFGLGLIPYARNMMLLKKREWAMKKERLFIVAGEKSGDLLGQDLADSLKEELPSCQMQGVGGPLMQKAGVDICYPIEKLSVMGFTDVLLALPRLMRAFREIEKKIFLFQPEAIVLIDYPDFNMHLAKRLRKKGYKGKIIHYVSPSVWAWRKKRVFKLAKTHDLLLSILPFEKRYYEKTSLKVLYVGHPLVKKEEGERKKSHEPLLALFPGSRTGEIERNLPLQLKVAKKWLEKHKNFSLTISAATPSLEEKITKILKEERVKARILPFDRRHQLMRQATLALATSGTVNLELALNKVPTLVTYKLSNLNYLLGRYIFSVRLPHYSIVNIVGEKSIYPEFIHRTLSEESLYTSLTSLYDKREECKKELVEVRKKLGGDKASKNAAVAIAKLLVAGSSVA